MRPAISVTPPTGPAQLPIRWLPILLLVLSTALLTALSPMIAAAGDTPPDESADAGDREARLGVLAFPNSGAPEAQEPFLAGVAALHSFWFDEAADLFRQAQQADPDFALAYWGEAMTYNHPLWDQQDREAALEALGRLGATPAERAAKAGTERERGFLAAVEALYDTGSVEPAAKKERDRRYAGAMARLSESHPADLEAASFHALALQGLQGPGELSIPLRMRSAAIVEEVFDANPRHPGAVHYLIHAYDDPVHAPLGLRAARVYAEIAPAANHALHMPSHIFVQLGMWDRAASSNEDAWAASVAWVERRGHPDTMRDFHSLSWLQYAYHQLGRHRDAAETVERAAALAEETGAEQLARVTALMRARQVVETGRWSPLPLPPEGAMDQYGAASSALFGAGYSAARRGDLDTAEEAAGRLAAIAEEHADDHRGKPAAAMGKQLEGVIALSRGQGEEALAKLAEAVRIEDELPTPFGPPMPIKPAAELYGETLLELGRPAEAAEQMAAALERTPNRTAALLGSARAAARLGDDSEARRLYAQLLAIWDAADPALPAVAEARGEVAAGAGGQGRGDD